ncbi:unnamed protein product [Allacma fusca]|uniref:RZ-type domain-containing protein n=1 Tax=Allacma fusca TaxID=39272 RepID=A0A8J2LIJ8_9HEXA|nr:unnamed protein product [Allacma fusca]
MFPRYSDITHNSRFEKPLEYVRSFDEDLMTLKPCSQLGKKWLSCEDEVTVRCSNRNPKCQTKVRQGFNNCGLEHKGYDVRVQLPCGHEVLSVCGNGKPTPPKCPFRVHRALPCGHTILTCKSENLECRKKIQKKYSCGHLALVSCGSQSECPQLNFRSLPCGHLVHFRCGTPIPKCWKIMTTVLPCGHSVVRICGQDIPICRICGRTTRLSCGHIVAYDCRKTPPTICTQMVTKILPCKHITTYPCGQKRPECTFTAMIKKKCGHEVLFRCGEDFSSTCTQTIKELLPCHHEVTYRCGQKCPPCKTTITIQRSCGHLVPVTCGSSYLPPTPCAFKCKKMCKRGHLCMRCHKLEDGCPPCKTLVCFTFGNCQHRLEIPCFEGDKESSKFCLKVCNRPRKCNHPCALQCGQHGSGNCPPCEILMKRKRYCGHEIIAFCKVDIDLEKCSEKVNASHLSYCGHHIEIECSKEELLEEDEAVRHCVERCGFYFDPKDGGCGHHCSGTCNLCAKNLFHEQCLEGCSKVLFCGHECTSRCSSTCMPCTSRCKNWCEHGACDHMCSLPCPPCKEPCKYECPHGKCTKECGQICNKVGCREKCQKKLEKCGHSCVGFCGELCPDLCAVCDSDELLKVCYDGRLTIDTTSRFIMLADCGHCIDAESMDRLMTVAVVEGEIVTKRCPLCRDVIRRCRRYSTELTKVRNDMEKVKKLVYGDTLEIRKHQDAISKSMFTLCAYDWKKGRKRDNQSYTLLREKLLAELFQRDACGIVISFKEMPLEVFHTLSFVSKIFVQSLISRKRFMETIPGNFAQHFSTCSNLIIDFLVERPWPLTPFERKALNQEWFRITSMTELLSKLDKSESEIVQRLLLQPRGQAAFMSAFEAINHVGPYDDRAQARFATELACLETALQCQIGISDSERIDILKAFNFSTGRWFKCPNGHVYVVTECGGVTEEGVCNECGAEIGGKNHSVLPTNQLASEMDGATRPLYPTALERQ